MARTWQNSGKSWYNRYPGIYARTIDYWQTRTGRRNTEFYQFKTLHGLDTANDDLNKTNGLSPYLRNVRFMGERVTTQRAQVTSRFGAKLLASYGDRATAPSLLDAEMDIEIWEGRTIKWHIDTDKPLVGGGLWLQNRGMANGILRVHIYNEKDGEPLCDAAIKLSEVSQKKPRYYQFRFIEASNVGRVWIRLEVYDDIDIEKIYDSNPYKGGHVIIKASGKANREEADYDRPNTDEALKESEYEWKMRAGAPLFGAITNDTKMLSKGYRVYAEDKWNIVFFAEESGTKYLFRYNEDKQEIIRTNFPVSQETDIVRFAQAGKWLFYVDGHSPLRRINLEDWTAEDAIPDCADIDLAPGEQCDPIKEELTAKEGASLILFVSDRLYLSGFKDDPNLVTNSLINSKGAQYDQFRDKFYSPDQETEQSKSSPVTALEEFDNQSIVIFRENGASTYDAPGGMEYGTVTQTDTFSSSIGVARQEDVIKMNGSIFYYNKSEGLRRFSGTSNSFTSSEVDNELSRIDTDADRFMFAHANKIRLWFDREHRGYSDHCLVYHQFLAQSGPWYMDNNVPVKWAVGSQTDNTIFAGHSQYIAVFEVDALNQNTDFDSPIKMEYHTDYRQSVDLSGYGKLERVHVAVIQSSLHSWFIGVDKNHEDNPSVWRKIAKKQEDIKDNQDDVFHDTAYAGKAVLNIGMKMRFQDFQIRVAVWCYDSQAELMYMIAEAGRRDAM